MENKVKVEFRASRRNKIKGRKSTDISHPYVFKSEHKPYTKTYAIELAKYMLTYCTDFVHIKYITGLTITNMLRLKLIEYYYPFMKTVYENAEDIKGTKVVNTDIKWLRAVKNV